LDTIRNEIAACLEKAYDKISLVEAARMLNFPNQTAIMEYGVKVCMSCDESPQDLPTRFIIP
jgi:hypothetical protein